MLCVNSARHSLLSTSQPWQKINKWKLCRVLWSGFCHGRKKLYGYVCIAVYFLGKEGKISSSWWQIFFIFGVNTWKKKKKKRKVSKNSMIPWKGIFNMSLGEHFLRKRKKFAKPIFGTYQTVSSWACLFRRLLCEFQILEILDSNVMFCLP